jgi:DNA repair protein RecO (recombination protein O)
VLCRNCRSGAAVSAGALALLRAILGGRLNEALATPGSPATHEVATLATKALEHHLERRLRAVAMFER